MWTTRPADDPEVTVLGSDILEVAIGVVFLFLLLAVIVSAFTEFISQAFGLRSKMLYKALAGILFDTATRDALYRHPLIAALAKSGPMARWQKKRVALPSYIPSDLLAKAILANVTIRDEGGSVKIEAQGDLAANEELTDVLKALGDPFALAAERAASLERDLAAWFDAAMDRVSGWYKRRAKTIVLIASFAIVIIANADAFRFGQALSVNPSARDAIVAAAADVVAPASPSPGASPALSTDASASLPTAEAARAALGKLDYGIGWDSSLPAGDPRRLPDNLPGWFDANFLGSHLPGWFVSAIAVSLGAPFWFNLLGDVLALRSAGVKPKPVER